MRIWPLLCLALAALIAPAPQARALTPETGSGKRPTGAMVFPVRESIDVSGFHVTNPAASYFDVPARRAALRTTTNKVLRAAIGEASFGVSCRNVMALPMPDKAFALPGFYVDNDGWREAAQVFLRFEGAMSELSAAQLVAEDTYHANCLVDVLAKWARAGALEGFVYSPDAPQAWYTVESTLFAAALALSTLRDLAPERAADLAEIDAWMVRLARTHSAITGLPSTACCNNHFLRRGVYAAIIGIMTRDDALFQVGVRAYLTGLSLAPDDGWLMLEMMRGRRAAHYQNFATLYLVFLAELIDRQGYDAYALRGTDGRSLREIATRTLDVIENPQVVLAHGGEGEQIMPLATDGQFLVWLEPYALHVQDPRLPALLAARRPLFNRSLGGAMTLIYMPAE